MTKAKRLLDYFVPSNYKVNLDLEDGYKNFSGSVGISGSIAKSTNVIYLHLNGPEVIKACVDGQEVQTSIDKDSQELSLLLPEEIIAGQQVVIEISFKSVLTTNMEGLYPSSYQENGQTKTLISSQFESTHAREAFPCVDEPAAKATFNLTLVTPQVKTILGNTPIKDQSILGGRVTTAFETTPKMSSYLVAIVVGDLAKLSGKTARGIEVNVFAIPDSASQLPFSLDVAIKSIDWYENYFGIDYPLPKLDMVAIPDFASGAMENWGLVTYRETAMLFDESKSSLAGKRRVIEVIAHELAHQWFGNLVTMNWWDDLWLNESFATFMAFYSCNEIFPELGFDESFMEDEYFPALHADCNSKTTSIYAPLEDPKDINEHFDPAITYGKGAAVLRMLHNYIGNDDFRSGLHNYLDSKQYANAVGDDLWNALAKTSGKPVDSFMRAWVKQPGHPIVTVTEDSLEQTRFFASPKERANSKDDNVWPIAFEDKFFDQSKTGFRLDKLKLNVDQYGVYRVKYSEAQMAKLVENVESDKLSDLDRMGLIDDAFSLSRAGLLKTDKALELTQKYSKITNNTVWDVVAGGLGNVSATFGDDELRPKIDKYVQNLIQTQYDRIGWQASAIDSAFDTMLRNIIIALAVKHRLPDAVTKASELFNKYIDNSEQIDPNLRGIVYSAVARDGGVDLFDKIFEKYRNEQMAEEKRRLAGALCSFKDKHAIEKALSLIKSDDVRQQDVVSWVFGLFGNRHSRDAVWQWQQDNWDWIESSFGSGHLYSYFVMGIGAFNDEAKAKEVEAFFDGKDKTGINRSLEQSLEQIRTKAAWKVRDSEVVRSFFDMQI
jgi:aminopeptidase N